MLATLCTTSKEPEAAEMAANGSCNEVCALHLACAVLERYIICWLGADYCTHNSEEGASVVDWPSADTKAMEYVAAHLQSTRTAPHKS